MRHHLTAQIAGRKRNNKFATDFLGPVFPAYEQKVLKTQRQRLSRAAVDVVFAQTCTSDNPRGIAVEACGQLIRDAGVAEVPFHLLSVTSAHTTFPSAVRGTASVDGMSQCVQLFGDDIHQLLVPPAVAFGQEVLARVFALSTV